MIIFVICAYIIPTIGIAIKFHWLVAVILFLCHASDGCTLKGLAWLVWVILALVSLPALGGAMVFPIVAWVILLLALGS